MKLCTVVWGWKTKIEFVEGQNPIMSSPVYPQFSPNFTNPNAFQWDGLSTAVSTPLTDCGG